MTRIRTRVWIRLVEEKEEENGGSGEGGKGAGREGKEEGRRMGRGMREEKKITIRQRGEKFSKM